MKKLHLVGFTRDLDGLILSPRKGAKTGGFEVALDDELVASILDARHRREHGDDPAENLPGPLAAPSRTRPTSALSPREIQSRLRAGSTIAEVAAQAGVGEEWVLRFADPILAEQGRVVESAQRLTFAKSRLGPSIEPLAESVQWNLTDRGVRFSDDVFANGWSAYNLHGARWAVRFTYSSRQRRHTAEWEVDLRERSLSARNRLASDLGHVEAGRRRPRLESVEHVPADGQIVQPPPVEGRGGARQSKNAGKAAARARGRKGTAKTASAKGTAAAGTRVAGAKSSAAAKKSAVAKQAAAAAKAAAAAGVKTSAANKAPAGTPSRKASTARSGPAAKAAATPAKKSGREPSSRKARAGKKPSSDAPAGAQAVPAAKAVTAPEALPERPSHLARPPSPMNTANKATSLPGRRLTSQFARQGASSPVARPPVARPPAPPRRQAPPAEEYLDGPAGPGSPEPQPQPQPQPQPPSPLPDAAPPAAGPGGSGPETPSPASTDRSAAGSPPPPPARRGLREAAPAKAPAARADADRAAARVVAPPLPGPVPLKGNGDDDRPAVVILSTPPSAPGPAATRPTRTDAGGAGGSGGSSEAGASGARRDPSRPGTADPRARRR